MKCSEARGFLAQVGERETPITHILPADLDYLTTNGYVLRTTKEEFNKGTAEVARLSQMIEQVKEERGEEGEAEAVLKKDEDKEHSFVFHFEGKEEKEALQKRVASETDVVSREESELNELEANVNSLIQEKSAIDRMVQYDDGFVSLTGLGTVVLNDLSVRIYRVADQELPSFLTEIRSTYDELRSIADRASTHAGRLRLEVPEAAEGDTSSGSSIVWSAAIGLAKLQGDFYDIADRFAKALIVLRDFKSALPNKLMAAEIMTATGSQDFGSLESTLKALDSKVRENGIPKEDSAGVAATILAGRRFDGSYPGDRFVQFKGLASSPEAASILAVMNVPYEALRAKFETFGELFSSWGYMKSGDTEIASAFLAISELEADEVQEKLKYVVEQLRNYLEYPLVGAAILASIPVFEAHELLDLMEKAVTLLSGYAQGLERSELVALAIRMIHGVRNELVKEIDPTARLAETPVQFTYSTHPGLFIWYYPVMVAHSYYHATFSGMGSFHPAHSHGVGGFAG